MTAIVTVIALMAQVIPQPSPQLPVAAQRELDSALAIVKHHSVWRDTVTWRVVEPAIRAMAVGAQRSSEAYPAITALLARVGDRGSALIDPTTNPSTSSDHQSPPPVVRVLNGGSGIVIVPGYGETEVKALRSYASALHDSLQWAMPQVSCGWIVDLRGNDGGNMWPMLAALKPFLGNAPLGTFISPTGAGDPWIAGRLVNVEPPSALGSLQSALVAVLTGGQTAGAGEAVAIAFRDRPHTRSFGLPTAGLSTTTEIYPLPDGAKIRLTDTIDADRMGTRYGGPVDPDEAMGTTPGANGADPQMAAARAWLIKQPGCRPSR